MDFTAHELRTLRYRMNWTQSEMARLVGCGLDVLTNWERGERLCDLTDQEKSKILIFLAQANSNSAQVQRRAVADDLMATRGLSQIGDGDVIECLRDGALSSLSFR